MLNKSSNLLNTQKQYKINNQETLSCSTVGDFNFWLSLSLSLSLSETLIWTLKSGLRPKFNLTSV